MALDFSGEKFHAECLSGGLVNFESNFHWGTSENKKMKAMGHNVNNISTDFHTYAVEWNEKGFKIYYDNILIRVFSNPKAIKDFKHPMHIIIGNQIFLINAKISILAVRLSSKQPFREVFWEDLISLW